MPATASEIIERVKARYAGCRSYEDTGTATEVTEQADDPDPIHRTRHQFRTAFVRTGHVLFGLADESDRKPEKWTRSVVWQNSRGAHMWSSQTPRAIKSVEFLFAEIVGLCGLAGRSALNPLALLGVVRGMSPKFADSASTVEIVAVEGGPNYMLSASESQAMVWIEADTWCLRRVESVEHHDGEPTPGAHRWFEDMLQDPNLPPDQRRIVEGVLAMPPKAHPYTKTTTVTWTPRMDHDIHPKVFEFTPPG